MWCFEKKKKKRESENGDEAISDLAISSELETIFISQEVDTTTQEASLGDIVQLRKV